MAVLHAPEAHYRLTADFDLGGRSFRDSLIPFFGGHFDGGGYCISNFTLIGETNVGLFGVLQSKAIVNDLHLRRVRTIPIDEERYVAASSIGALAACNQGTVAKCSTITETSNEAGYTLTDIGGLIGVNHGGQVSMCSSRWALAASAISSGGGLVGRNTGTISQCYASVYANCGIHGLGGLVGRNAGSILGCYADGYLSGPLTERRPDEYTGSAGGLVADNDGTIANCYTTMEFATTPRAGGLVGGDESEGIVVDSYFLAEADGGGADNGFGTMLSEAQMRQRGSFAGWDFENVWTICEDADYPRLQVGGCGLSLGFVRVHELGYSLDLALFVDAGQDGGRLGQQQAGLVAEESIRVFQFGGRDLGAGGLQLQRLVVEDGTAVFDVQLGYDDEDPRLFQLSVRHTVGAEQFGPSHLEPDGEDAVMNQAAAVGLGVSRADRDGVTLYR